MPNLQLSVSRVFQFLSCPCFTFFSQFPLISSRWVGRHSHRSDACTSCTPASFSHLSSPHQLSNSTERPRSYDLFLTFLSAHLTITALPLGLESSLVSPFFLHCRIAPPHSCLLLLFGPLFSVATTSKLFLLFAVTRTLFANKFTLSARQTRTSTLGATSRSCDFDDRSAVSCTSDRSRSRLRPRSSSSSRSRASPSSLPCPSATLFR